MAQSCLGMAGLEIPVTCVYVLGCRGICYTALPDTGVFCDCRVGQAPHWIIPYSLEHTILPFCSTPFKSGLFFYSFGLIGESCMLSIKQKNLELLY